MRFRVRYAPLELAQALRAAVSRVDHASGLTSIEATAAQARAGSRGVCQDYAHCLVALSRL